MIILLFLSVLFFLTAMTHKLKVLQPLLKHVKYEQLYYSETYDWFYKQMDLWINDSDAYAHSGTMLNNFFY